MMNRWKQHGNSSAPEAPFSMFSRRGYMVGVLLVFAFMLASPYSADSDTHAREAEKPDVLAVVMHADWCGYCDELRTQLTEVQSEFEDRSVLFLQFDFSNGFTRWQTKLRANWTGLARVYERHKGRTGYVLLLDPETLEEINRIRYNDSKQAMRAILAGALR